MKRFVLLALLLPSLAACAPPYDSSATTAPSVAAAKTSTPPASAVTPTAPIAADDVEALKAKLSDKLQTTVDRIKPSPIAGLYEIQSGMNFAYVTADGEYMIEGDLIRLDTGEALTETERRKARLAALDKIGLANMIDFSPAKPKHVITVFTDIDCGYCRKMHSEIAGYNKNGIGVRYVFFPRSGPDTESFRKAKSVWCAADRKAAFTTAKRTGNFNGPSDCVTPIMDHYMTGISIGVRGTPALVLTDGTIMPGYLPPDQLLERLDQHFARIVPGG